MSVSKKRWSPKLLVRTAFLAVLNPCSVRSHTALDLVGTSFPIFPTYMLVNNNFYFGLSLIAIGRRHRHRHRHRTEGRGETREFFNFRG